MIKWKKLDSISKLDDIIEDSYNAPQVIFKHSTSCPISSMAKRRVEGGWNLDITAHYLDLIAFRSISNEISSRFSVQHESPQILLIKDGKAVYDESHLDISVPSLQASL